MEKWLEEALWNQPMKMLYQGRVIIISAAQLKAAIDQCVEDGLFGKEG